MDSSPRELWPYDDAWDLQRKMRDEESWISGIYTFKAVSIALENALKRRGQKATEYVQEPFLKNWKAKGLSEREKIAGTKQVFATLEMLKTNFELEKNKGGGV